MKNQKELFVVERSDGEWIDSYDRGGYSVFSSLGEAQDALESEADSAEDAEENYRPVRFVREPVEEPASPSPLETQTCPTCGIDIRCIHGKLFSEKCEPCEGPEDQDEVFINGQAASPSPQEKK